jgi:hypothetical protein
LETLAKLEDIYLLNPMMMNPQLLLKAPLLETSKRREFCQKHNVDIDILLSKPSGTPPFFNRVRTVPISIL